MAESGRWTAREAIALLCDDFTEHTRCEEPSGEADGPIGWEGYDAARARAEQATGSTESVLWGEGTLGGDRRCVLLSFEFAFLGGSLSRRAGDRLEAAYTHARERGLPLVSLIATGGSRMQEGMVALGQLQRAARAGVLLREAGVPHIAVVRDPTTGGGWATLGAGADVILALPGAQVAFAGSRVRPQDADPAAYTAESQLAHGHVDAVVRPERLRETVGFWARALAPGVFDPQPAPPPDALPPGGEMPLPRTGWDAVLRARDTRRAPAEAYLDRYFARREPLGGDRGGGVDPGLLCGAGVRAADGRAVVYVAQRGTATRPAGYRTAARVIRLADRFGLPVLTLVDTPGAANDAAAERAGAGGSIAEAFSAMAAARTPLTSLLIGEGGSGGALALAAPGNTWATPDSYFSVIAPESAAAILKRSPDRIPRTADQLRLRPQDLVELGVVRGIVPRAAPEQASAPE
ncbi:carboxyl transferase domain-containing protein [Streptomyces sp. MUM 178J]|uniref:carboxyl transferase domain-containing protein n=1 Tax=Streptomyces sp. MUM 178J TaxID=2791991 RepID=UPI001F0370D6|nr:carboxyl transferase domain-containing protein [Streptomyces sp. MUM 178J]WRQ79287.1 carboxyl transferase domain-containing protein [Streptomyces sp. MUM 178J]